LEDQKVIIGQGSDYHIVWDDSFPMLDRIVTLVDHIKSAGAKINKQDLQETIDPNFRYCCTRMDDLILDVSELIESFTYSDATIYHNRKMHASIHQNITILKTRETEFISYLETVHKALASLAKAPERAR
jgi:hypothetical protein